MASTPTRPVGAAASARPRAAPRGLPRAPLLALPLAIAAGTTSLPAGARGAAPDCSPPTAAEIPFARPTSQEPAHAAQPAAGEAEPLEFRIQGPAPGPVVMVQADAGEGAGLAPRAAAEVAGLEVEAGLLVVLVGGPAEARERRASQLGAHWIVTLEEDGRKAEEGGGPPTVYSWPGAEALEHARSLAERVNDGVLVTADRLRARPRPAPPSDAGDATEVPGRLWFISRVWRVAADDETRPKYWRPAERIRHLRALTHGLLHRLGMVAAGSSTDVFTPRSLRRGREGGPADVHVAVYDGDGAGAPMPFARDLETLEALGVLPLGPGEIARGALAGFDVAIFPGGMASEQFAALGSAGREAVRRFVLEGGGFVGLCAGAYLAAPPPYAWGIGILDATILDHDHWARGIGKVEIELSEAGRALLGRKDGRLSYHYGNGPILGPGGEDEIPDYTPLAWYRTGLGVGDADPRVMVDTPAIVAGHFGLGRVLASSGHAEWSEGIEDFLPRYVEWAAGRSDLPVHGRRGDSSRPPTPAPPE
ncbi:MAG: BPL-N domain-containing protein [Planctomycetota bacterium]|nr:BPL-N domain-containing protein [Planctomycetota bacterium]